MQRIMLQSLFKRSDALFRKHGKESGGGDQNKLLYFLNFLVRKPFFVVNINVLQTAQYRCGSQLCAF